MSCFLLCISAAESTFVAFEAYVFGVSKVCGVHWFIFVWSWHKSFVSYLLFVSGLLFVLRCPSPYWKGRLRFFWSFCLNTWSMFMLGHATRLASRT